MEPAQPPSPAAQTATDPDGPPATWAREADLLAALRGGEESAFARLVDGLSPAMLKMASIYVPSRVAAEEAVQDPWLAAPEGLDRFEGRSSLQTWIFRLL